MIDLLISGLFTILALLSCAVFLKFEKVKTKKSVKAVFPENKKQLVFGVSMIVSVLVVFIMLNFLYNAPCIYTIKRIVICSALWPIALIDFRKHIIPNKILIVLAIVRVLICIPEFILNFNFAKEECISCAIATLAIMILFCILRLIVKSGIGFGDIKLFAVIGLFFGIRGSISSIFVSFIISFILSIYMLATKKKNKNDQIAFAPSILVGTFLSVIFLGA